jgi:hypothetical protein
LAFAVTVTAPPLPDIVVGDTPHPDIVKVVVVKPDPELPNVSFTDIDTFALLTEREKVPELEE